MRKSFDGLCSMVSDKLARNPMSGEVFIFINKRRDRIKLLHWESGGFVIYHKRLESGCFERPVFDLEQNAFQMRWSELVMMIQGLSMKNIVQRKRFSPSQASQAANNTVVKSVFY